METTLQERIKYLMTVLKISPQQFCEKMGIQRSSLSHLLSGRNKPGFDFIEKLLHQFPVLNLEWFINGTGVPTKTNQLDSKFTDVTSDNFTNVNKREVISESEELVSYGNLIPNNRVNVEIKVQKVIVIYEDNTFEVFKSK